MSYAFSSLDELGDGPGFRKIRAALGVTAFGINGIVMPPGHDGFLHFHDTQDELYFVHRGRVEVEVDGEKRVLGEGGLFHVDSTTSRKVSNPFDEDGCCSRSAARAATSSVTGTWSTRRTSPGAPRSASARTRAAPQCGSRRPRRCAGGAPAPRRARSCSSRSGRDRSVRRERPGRGTGSPPAGWCRRRGSR